MKKTLDYDERYDMPERRIDETSFIEHDTTGPKRTLRLKQKLKRDKTVSLYMYLDVTSNPGSADLDQFTIKKNSKIGNVELLFFDSNNEWQSLTNKHTGEVLAPKTLTEKFGSINAIKNFLGVDTPPAFERSVKAASKRKSELSTDLQMKSIPLKDPSSLAEEIHVKTQEASQQTTLNMREFLVIDKALQSIQGELLNNTAKLTEIDKRIKKDTKK